MKNVRLIVWCFTLLLFLAIGYYAILIRSKNLPPSASQMQAPPSATKPPEEKTSLLPILSVMCVGEDSTAISEMSSIGTAFVVRISSTPAEEPIALTAAHVAERLKSSCKSFFLEGARTDGLLNGSVCKYHSDKAKINMPLQDIAKDAEVVFPLDLAAIRFAKPRSGCKFRSLISMRLNYLQPARQSLRTIFRDSGGRHLTFGRRVLTLEPISPVEDPYNGLVVKADTGEGIGGGYSGAPALIVDDGIATLSASGIITQRVPSLGDINREVSRLGFVQPTAAVATLPKAGAEALFSLVPPTNNGLRLIGLIRSCKLSANDVRNFTRLDIFDEFQVIREAFSKSYTCSKSVWIRQQELLRISATTSRPFIADLWPTFSLNPNGVSTDLIAKAANCVSGHFQLSSDGEKEIALLYSYAITAKFKLLPDPNLGDKQTVVKLRERALCQSFIQRFISNPYLILQNLQLEYMLSKSVDPAGFRFYADFFGGMADKGYRPNVGRDDPYDRLRAAIISFRLFDLCYRSPPCPTTAVEVFNAAYKVATNSANDNGTLFELEESGGSFSKKLKPLLRKMSDIEDAKGWETLYNSNDLDEQTLGIIAQAADDDDRTIRRRPYK